jgi:hypothetical protein
MGYMRHHSIIVTGYDQSVIKAHDKAIELFGPPLVSEMVRSVTNCYESFFVAPDGSKEGWEESDSGDKKRAELIEYLKSQAYDDGSSSLDWCEIQYGDEEGDNRLLHSEADTQVTTAASSDPDTIPEVEKNA